MSIEKPLEQGDKAQNITTETTANTSVGVKEVKATNDNPKTTNNIAKPEMVSIPKDQLNSIAKLIKEQGEALKSQAKDIEKLKSGIDQGPRIAKKIKEHFVTLREYEGQIVKGYDGDVYNEYDERKREFVLYVDLILYNDKIVKKVKYLDFVSNAKRVSAKIIKKEENEISNVEGLIRKNEPSGEYGTVSSDSIVEVESIIKEYKFEVELENGNVLNLSEKVINI